MTENVDHIETKKIITDDKKDKGKDKADTDLSSVNAVPMGSFGATGQMIASAKGPMPLLEPPQVLRIWVAPFVDEKQDLQWPSYVFTEVTSRRWSFGEQSVPAIKALVPVQLAPAQAEEISGQSVDDQARQAIGGQTKFGGQSAMPPAFGAGIPTPGTPPFPGSLPNANTQDSAASFQ